MGEGKEKLAQNRSFQEGRVEGGREEMARIFRREHMKRLNSQIVEIVLWIRWLRVLSHSVESRWLKLLSYLIEMFMRSHLLSLLEEVALWNHLLKLICLFVEMVLWIHLHCHLANLAEVMVGVIEAHSKFNKEIPLL